MNARAPARFAVLLFAAVLAACATPPERHGSVTASGEFELRVLHINDHHSRLDADSGQQLLLDGAATDVSLGGFARLVTAFRELGMDAPNVLRLHSGDAMSGDLYHTLFGGEADADLMNQVCFDAFVPGNHEFDQGDAGLKALLDFLSKRLWRCATPAVAANVNPQVGKSPLRQFAIADYLLPHVIVERSGRRIGIVGIVGIVTAQETKSLSNPLER
jgi:5'-nucleotidase